ncbi:hypothetical protein J6590_072657 [Homalodisca vitripennis]|nr:hypothetical protein J6590_072657 [Homalodisca vitripennis]
MIDSEVAGVCNLDPDSPTSSTRAQLHIWPVLRGVISKYLAAVTKTRAENRGPLNVPPLTLAFPYAKLQPSVSGRYGNERKRLVPIVLTIFPGLASSPDSAGALDPASPAPAHSVQRAVTCYQDPIAHFISSVKLNVIKYKGFNRPEVSQHKLISVNSGETMCCNTKVLLPAIADLLLNVRMQVVFQQDCAPARSRQHSECHLSDRSGQEDTYILTNHPPPVHWKTMAIKIIRGQNDTETEECLLQRHLDLRYLLRHRRRPPRHLQPQFSPPYPCPDFTDFLSDALPSCQKSEEFDLLAETLRILTICYNLLTRYLLTTCRGRFDFPSVQCDLPVPCTDERRIEPVALVSNLRTTTEVLEAELKCLKGTNVSRGYECVEWTVGRVGRTQPPL